MKNLASLQSFFWKYRIRLGLGILFIILTNYFRILTPQLTGYIVNTVAGVRKTSPHLPNDFLVHKVITALEGSSSSDKIIGCSVLLLCLSLISGLFMFMMRQTIIVMSRLIEYDQKNQVFSHYQLLDAGFYKRQSTGDLMNRLSEDVSRVRMFTGPAVMYIINLTAVIGFSIFFMFRASPRLTWVSLSPLPVLAVTIYLVNTIINRRSEKIQEMLSRLTSNAQQSYSGIRVIKSFVQEGAMLDHFRTNTEDYRRNVLALARTEAIYFPSIALLIGISTLFTIMVGALDVANGRPGADVGVIAEFVMYIQMMTFPVSAIGWTASITQRAAASQKRINEFLDARPAVSQPANPVKVVPAGEICFREVNFTYPETGIQSLRNFNLTIRKGEKIAIVGKTGSGKSTIAQLLLRVYDPQCGQVTLSGTDLRNIDLGSLRESLGYVPQDVFLFSDTVHNNIAFGLPGASREQVIKAAECAVVHREITQFREGYDTMIGERGVTLSGGQKQRISIARGLIKEPSVLVLDDCLSAVDARTEKEIMNNLNSYLHDKTAIIITHRVFSLLQFDRIILMEQGAIAEQGTHDTLMAARGSYASLYLQQQETNPVSGFQ